MTAAHPLAALVLLLGVATAPLASAQSTTPVVLLRLAQEQSSLPRDSCRRMVAARAQETLSAHRWTEAVTLWEDALARNGGDAQHWQAYGDALYRAARYRESIAAFEQAMLLGGAESEGAWKVARAYARLDNRKQALRWLGTALERGERSRQNAREEAAFERLRDDPRFRELTETNAAAHRARPGAQPRPFAITAG